jgi:hypothetical protein
MTKNEPLLNPAGSKSLVLVTFSHVSPISMVSERCMCGGYREVVPIHRCCQNHGPGQVELCITGQSQVEVVSQTLVRHHGTSPAERGPRLYAVTYLIWPAETS